MLTMTNTLSGAEAPRLPTLSEMTRMAETAVTGLGLSTHTITVGRPPGTLHIWLHLTDATANQAAAVVRAIGGRGEPVIQNHDRCGRYSTTKSTTDTGIMLTVFAEYDPNHDAEQDREGDIRC